MLLEDKIENNLCDNIKIKINNRYILIGTIKDAFGVKGLVKVKLFFENPKRFDTIKIAFLGKDYLVSEICFEKQLNKSVWLARFSTLASREEIKKFKGQSIFCNRDILPSLGRDEYYYSELIGLKIKIQKDKIQGFIQNVVNYGSGDLLEIKLENLQTTFFIPFNQENVTDISLKKKTILITPQKGLLPGT